jgi:hypothetical protein
MSAAATPNPTAQPDANPVADKGSHAGRLLDLVRKLIDYGKEIAGTLRQRAATGLGFDAFRFGTRDLTLILARITRGLHLATALEARVLQNAARLDAEPAASPAPSRHKPRAAQPAARRAPEADTILAHLPTPEQIAAEVRRRPIGAVIADICRDLGIMPNHPLWRELQHAIIRYGGSLAGLVKDILTPGESAWQVRAGRWTRVPGRLATVPEIRKAWWPAAETPARGCPSPGRRGCHRIG